MLEIIASKNIIYYTALLLGAESKKIINLTYVILAIVAIFDENGYNLVNDSIRYHRDVFRRKKKYEIIVNRFATDQDQNLKTNILMLVNTLITPTNPDVINPKKSFEKLNFTMYVEAAYDQSTSDQLEIQIESYLDMNSSNRTSDIEEDVEELDLEDFLNSPKIKSFRKKIGDSFPNNLKLEELKKEENKNDVKVEQSPVKEPIEIKIQIPNTETKVEETPKQETKVEEPKQIKVEPKPIENPKVEEKKIEEPKVEEIKFETPKIEDINVLQKKGEEIKVEESKKEIKVEEPKVEPPKIGGPPPPGPRAPGPPGPPGMKGPPGLPGGPAVNLNVPKLNKSPITDQLKVVRVDKIPMLKYEETIFKKMNVTEHSAKIAENIDLESIKRYFNAKNKVVKEKKEDAPVAGIVDGKRNQNVCKYLTTNH